jgi:hypothetical protein
LPLWIAEDDAAFGGMLLADNGRALRAGLVVRPLEDTVAATLSWAQQCLDDPDAGARRVATLTAEREAQLLA